MSHHGHPVIDSSASSSMASIAQHLPRLTETGEMNRALPKMPLRVPQRNPRRSLPAAVGGAPASYVPSRDSAAHLSEPPTPTSPPLSPCKLTASEAGTSELHSPRCSVVQQKRAHAEPPGDEKGWIDHRQRRCRFMIVVGVFTAIVAGLTVGLAVGLGKGNAQPNSQSSPDGADSAVFPAGAYSFETYLRANSSGCTSRASSWQCYPETSASSLRATFYWTVQGDVGGAHHDYYVTGTEEPFGPAFANLPATLLDVKQPSERLSFAFAANKTVVIPVAAGDGRVANCTYPGTVFQATLWTRRRGGQGVSAPSRTARYAPWPGEMEVVQYKNSTIGDPVCVDRHGKAIADVQAAGGSCLCRYTSTSMS
ncbi:hypothetical protein A9K55_008481 [Cordyceps militaris]|uniref:Tat pathway signal sequence n=1 Tax=Cordyceps militaris TaxID=73501 RepID=A0A2H4SIR1_CORMI|nr:hypothetical protein A9K55_008481 [Cordyceps militaris]